MTLSTQIKKLIAIVLLASSVCALGTETITDSGNVEVLLQSDEFNNSPESTRSRKIWSQESESVTLQCGTSGASNNVGCTVAGSESPTLHIRADGTVVGSMDSPNQLPEVDEPSTPSGIVMTSDGKVQQFGLTRLRAGTFFGPFDPLTSANMSYYFELSGNIIMRNGELIPDLIDLHFTRLGRTVLLRVEGYNATAAVADGKFKNGNDTQWPDVFTPEEEAVHFSIPVIDDSTTVDGIFTIYPYKSICIERAGGIPFSGNGRFGWDAFEVQYTTDRARPGKPYEIIWD